MVVCLRVLGAGRVRHRNPEDNRASLDDRGGVAASPDTLVMYLKAGTCDGEISFVIHGADGIPVCGSRRLGDSDGGWSLSKVSSSSQFIEEEPTTDVKGH